MNEKEARRHIEAIKGFYAHLWSFVIVMIGLAAMNVSSYLDGRTEIWVVMPFFIWGGFVFLHGFSVFRASRGKKWEEEKFRELTGWSASGEELANLSDRVDILLSIISSADSDAGFDVDEAKSTLEDVKRTIEYYQAPLDRSSENTIEKNKVIRLIEKLEAAVTSREFRAMNSDLNT